MLLTGVATFKNPKLAPKVPSSVMVTPSRLGRTPNGSQNGANRLSIAYGKNSTIAGNVTDSTDRRNRADADGPGIGGSNCFRTEVARREAKGLRRRHRRTERQREGTGG